MAKQRKKIDTSILEKSSEVSIEGLFGDQANVPMEASPKGGVNIPLSKITLNRFHARQILPLDIKKRFFLGEIDYKQAVLDYIELSKNDPLLQKRLNCLRELGNSLLIEGQINPVSGNWQKNGEEVVTFQLETGARRFWGLAILHAEKTIEEEPKLKVSEISENLLYREISENYRREDLSAVEIGISIASVILLEAGISPNAEVDNVLDYYREALNHANRTPEIWDKLEILFSISHEKIKNYLQILELSDDLVFKAALNRFSEKRIRNVLLLPKFQQESALFSEINEKETAPDKEPENIPRQVPDEPNSDSPAHIDILANHIHDWFELVNKEFADGNFKDLAKDLSSRLEDPADLDNLARRLVNLSRDIRVEQTRRRQY